MLSWALAVRTTHHDYTIQNSVNVNIKIYNFTTTKYFITAALKRHSFRWIFAKSVRVCISRSIKGLDILSFSIDHLSRLISVRKKRKLDQKMDFICR